MICNNGGDQAGGVLQVAGEAQHAASPWLGQLQAEREQGEQLWTSDLNNSVVSVISQIRYVVSSNNMLADNNKCDERTGIWFITCTDLFTICMYEHNFGITKNLQECPRMSNNPKNSKGLQILIIIRMP